MKTKSALSYFGSDSEVAGDLAAMLNHCQHVTIPFVGGAAILPHLTARAIVANDLHSLAINFYRVMSQPDLREYLISFCACTLSHPGEITAAKTLLDSDSSIERAWAFWALCWIPRKGKGGTKHQGGLPSVRRKANGGNNASRIRAAADDLGQWAKHFERCEWESKDFREVLPSVADDESCGIYCDPPWPGAGRNYVHNFNDNDHLELSKALSRFEKTTVVVRYGEDSKIRTLYEGWRVIETKTRDQANNNKPEIWITNK